MTISIRSELGLSVAESFHEAKAIIIHQHLCAFPEEDQGWLETQIRGCETLKELQGWVEDYLGVEEVL